MIPRASLFLLLAVNLVPAADPALPPVVYKSADELAAALAKSAAGNPDQIMSAIANEGHYRINIVKRERQGVAMAHGAGAAKGTEVHYILEGAATVVTGGTLKPRGAGSANGSIEGGKTQRVKKGDAIVIPAGTPHWYQAIEGSVTYLEVRFDVELGK